MDTSKNITKIVNETKRFIILVPHRDAIKPLGEYRQRLFAAGHHSAFSFPLSAVLAEVSNPFDREELKVLARSIRRLTGKTGGKVLANANCTVAESRQLSFYGPPLNLSMDERVFPGSAKEKLLCIPKAPVLCVALAGENLKNGEIVSISFRAAYIANLAIRPLAGTDFSFQWKTGEPVWLPKAALN